MQLDRDLASIQEVRDLIRAAKKAQALLAEMNQRQVDDIVRAMSEAACRHARELAHMAVEETGFGVEGDKVTKNLFAGRTVYESIRDVRSIGIIGEDREKRILEAAVPVGVVAGLVPSTNPTSTTIFKALISVKAGNALIVSPHPSAVRCIGRTVEILTEAAGRMGAPAGMLSMMTLPTLQGTSELMKLSDLILATGGTAMVKAAYSSGTPALGVGPGNVPAYIERTANIPDAVRRILASKTFDNGTICASEQSIVTERCVKNEVIAELKRQGGHFVSGEDADRLARVILRPGAATVNPRIVGAARRPSPTWRASASRSGRPRTPLRAGARRPRVSLLHRKALAHPGLLHGGGLAKRLREMPGAAALWRNGAQPVHAYAKRRTGANVLDQKTGVPPAGQHRLHTGRHRRDHGHYAFADAGLRRGGRERHQR